MMKFYILKHDYETSFKKENNNSFSVYQGTAVIRYKKWFFECLRQYGKIVTLDERFKKEKLCHLLNKPDAIFVSVHGGLNRPEYYRVPRRMLELSLGTLLVSPEDLYTAKHLPSAQVLLVSTDFQIKKLESIFNNLMPRMYAFSNKVDTNFFIPPDKKQKALARRKQGIKEEQIHIIYAGRWIVTKGICQLIRTLDIWPIPNIVLTLAGNIEENFKLAYSFARHNNFSDFLDNEIFQKKRNWLRFQPAKNKENLRELFWSGDLFVNPSIQPDEDFGVTPREAVSCGLPIVTSNFGGLNPLAEGMPWKGLDTYPTLFGSRFSLKQFHHLLRFAVEKHRYYYSEDYRKIILNEYTPEIGKKNLRLAIEYLKNKAPENPINVKIIERKVKKQLFNVVNERAFKLFINSRQKLPAGSYIYGDGPLHHTFPMVQGIYSALNSPPMVERHTRWRGFFRISMWEQERALVEFGFPGPRIRHYSKKLWDSLQKCSHLTKSNDYVIIPVNKLQISQIQELVNLGYLVSDAQ